MEISNVNAQPDNPLNLELVPNYVLRLIERWKFCLETSDRRRELPRNVTARNSRWRRRLHLLLPIMV